MSGPLTCPRFSLAEIEADAAHVAAAVRDAVPDLSWKGFGPVRFLDGATIASFAASRHEMVEARHCAELVRAAVFIDMVPRRISPRAGLSSYGWKHEAERYWCDQGVASNYVSNGMFIVAALALGVAVERTPGSPNARIGLDPRSMRGRSARRVFWRAACADGGVVVPHSALVVDQARMRVGAP